MPTAREREERAAIWFLEGRRRALGDKALFSNLIITLKETRRREERKRREENKRRRGEEKEKEKVATIGEREPKR